MGSAGQDIVCKFCASNLACANIVQTQNSRLDLCKLCARISRRLPFGREARQPSQVEIGQAHGLKSQNQASWRAVTPHHGRRVTAELRLWWRATRRTAPAAWRTVAPRRAVQWRHLGSSVIINNPHPPFKAHSHSHKKSPYYRIFQNGFRKNF